MKKLVSVCLLLLCLSLPVFAGHILIGGRSEWCECGSFAECICEPGEEPLGNRVSVPAKPKTNNLGPETLLVFAALLLMLRYKA